MYMQLQRQQPTYAKLRSSLREGLTEAVIREQYPSMAIDLVDTLLSDVRTANDLDVFVDEFACESSHDHIGGESYGGERRTHDEASVAGTLTEQAQKPTSGYSPPSAR